MTTTESAPAAPSEDGAPAVCVPLPGLGTIELSRPELVYIAGIAALGVFGLLEWPVALAIGAGHLLAADRSSRAARALGRSLEEAG